MAKKKKSEYDPNKTYKITVVLKTGERQVKYFKGYEMEEKERLIKNKISKINYWFYEELYGSTY